MYGLDNWWKYMGGGLFAAKMQESHNAIVTVISLQVWSHCSSKWRWKWMRQLGVIYMYFQHVLIPGALNTDTLSHPLSSSYICTQNNHWHLYESTSGFRLRQQPPPTGRPRHPQPKWCMELSCGRAFLTRAHGCKMGNAWLSHGNLGSFETPTHVSILRLQTFPFPPLLPHLPLSISNWHRWV